MNRNNNCKRETNVRARVHVRELWRRAFVETKRSNEEDKSLKNEKKKHNENQFTRAHLSVAFGFV